MSKFNFKQYIEENMLRQEISRRGGGIEIDASKYLDFPGAKVTAYQNYLGGGLLGSVQADRNFSITSNKVRETKVKELQEALKIYFFAISNELAGDWDKWAKQTYESNQNMPVSAY